MAHAILLRRAFEGQRLQAPTQVLFGADDFYIPVAVLEEIETHGADLTLEVVEGCALLLSTCVTITPMGSGSYPFRFLVHRHAGQRQRHDPGLPA